MSTIEEFDDRPIRRRDRVIAYTGSVAMIAAIVGAGTVAVFDGRSLVEALGGPWLLVQLALPAAGILLLLVRPGMPYVRFFAAIAGGLCLSLLLVNLATALEGDPIAGWLGAAGDALNTLSIGLAVGLLLLLFPAGRLPSRRWRWPAAGAVLVAILGATAAFLVGGWGGDSEQAVIASPLRDSAAGDIGAGLSELFFRLLMLVFLTTAASLVVRWRRAEGIERKQMQWLVVGASYLVVVLVIGALTGPIQARIGADAVETWLTSFGMALLPLSVGIAVLRYRLYDVDVVISKSLIVAGLAAFILAVYVGVVVGIGTLVTHSDEPNLALQVGATALVAVGFQPWRRRLRRWVDRVVYGHRASPYDVLAAFSRIAARTPDEATRDEIADLLARGTGADPAVLWLRVGDRMRPVASRPSQVELDSVPVSSDQVPDLAGDLVVPVRHDDELLGALSVSKPRGEQLSPQDIDVTEQLAASVALTLRAERLTAELAERLDELKTSRARIVQAQDEARRRLERDLHDGAQQQLVALKVKLGLARSNAERAQATRTAGLLEQIGADADDAVESLRDLARGIHPPMLEAEGLSAAIRAQARKAALPVEVIDQGAGRAHRDTELAVYYCVLEALQNTAKYAQATSAVVTLGRDGDEIVFSVRDDGDGFDPTTANEGTGIQGMRDRIDTVEGTLEIEAAPGRGTTVRGRAPQAGPGTSIADGELVAVGAGTGTSP